MATLPSNLSEPWRPRISDAVVVILVTAALGISYSSSILSLVEKWSNDPNYSFGFLVLPIALAIFWTRRRKLDRARMNPRWWGFLPLVAILGVRVLLFKWNEQYVETASVPMLVAVLALALGGWHLVRVSLPALIFLFFMLPLPPGLNSYLADPLQRLATLGSLMILRIMGMPVLADGNVITIGAEPLEVAQACNGLSMLLSFITLITAMVILIPRPLWERIVLMLSAIPIALVSNILRIVITAWCYHRFGHAAGEKMAHDAAGLAMPLVALALALLEIRILSWLVVEVEEKVDRPTRHPGIPPTHRNPG